MNTIHRSQRSHQSSNTFTNRCLVATIAAGFFYVLAGTLRQPFRRASRTSVACGYSFYLFIELVRFTAKHNVSFSSSTSSGAKRKLFAVQSGSPHQHTHATNVDSENVQHRAPGDTGDTSWMDEEDSPTKRDAGGYSYKGSGRATDLFEPAPVGR